MSKTIRIAHSIGEQVFLRTDLEQLPHLCTRITISQSGIEYQLRNGRNEATWHQACEIMREPKERRKTGY